MIKITVKNKSVYVSKVKNSRMSWSFVLNENGDVESAKVLPPESLVYGEKITLDNLSEEDVNSKFPENVQAPEKVMQAITLLEDILSKRYTFGEDPNSFFHEMMTMRTTAIKQNLGLADDTEYSRENEAVASMPYGKIFVNFAMKPVKIEFDLNRTKPKESSFSGLIKKPTQKKLEE